MSFDPGTMMAIMSALSTVVGGLTGEKGGAGSTYNKNQLSGLDKVLNDVMGMRGQGQNDITQNQNFQGGQNWLNDLFGNDQNFFDKFEAPIKRQFEEQTIPNLANQFASMGSGGSQGSTAFRNQLGREGSNLSTNLAALRGGMQQQGVGQSLQYAQQPVQNYMQMLQQALQPTQNTYQGPSQGIMGGMAAPFAQGAANYWGGQGGNNAGVHPSTQSGYGAGWDSMFRNNPGMLT
jgi:hypothetical protein